MLPFLKSITYLTPCRRLVASREVWEVRLTKGGDAMGGVDVKDVECEEVEADWVIMREIGRASCRERVL